MKCPYKLEHANPTAPKLRDECQVSQIYPSVTSAGIEYLFDLADQDNNIMGQFRFASEDHAQSARVWMFRALAKCNGVICPAQDELETDHFGGPSVVAGDDK